MLPKFDNQGLDAWLDIKEQTYLVLASHDRFEAAEESSDPTNDAEEDFNTELEVLRTLVITAAEHGIPDETMRDFVVDHLPSDVLNHLFTHS